MIMHPVESLINMVEACGGSNDFYSWTRTLPSRTIRHPHCETIPPKMSKSSRHRSLPRPPSSRRLRPQGSLLHSRRRHLSLPPFPHVKNVLASEASTPAASSSKMGPKAACFLFLFLFLLFVCLFVLFFFYSKCLFPLPLSFLLRVKLARKKERGKKKEVAVREK